MRYLKIDVTRSESSTVFIAVPDDYDTKIWPSGKVIREACIETISDGEWESDGPGYSIEAQTLEEVEESEALQYNVYDMEAESSL